jgi:hypothetical protein
MHFALKELRKLISVAIPESSKILYDPSRAREFVESLLPSESIARSDEPEQSVISPTQVLMLSSIDEMEDIYSELTRLRIGLEPSTRIYVVTMSKMWSRLRNRIYDLSHGSLVNNWIPPTEIANLFEQTGFEIVQQRKAVIIPIQIPFLSRIANRWLSQIPIIRHFSVFNIVTVRPKLRELTSNPKVSIVVAARNEAGNIQNLIDRLPNLSTPQELIFVEGGSDDSTWETIQTAINQNQDKSKVIISAYKQTGKGKGDAVRLGFSKATGEILIILDADLSVPPEELPRFVENLKNDNCEFANGSRLVYPMEDRAMQFLNLIGNRLFGIVFSFLIGQSVRDTLCGTKAMWADDYRRLAAQREYFGDFDPFGDFDLLFGASRLGLKIRDVPVHYKERVYGSTNISRFRHGLLLIKMTAFAAKRLKFVK